MNGGLVRVAPSGPELADSLEATRKALFTWRPCWKVRRFGLWLEEEIEIRGGVSCWVCSRLAWLLFPLSQEPNTEPGHQDQAGECQEFSQHICSLLCTFSLLWDVKSAAGAPRMRPPCCAASEGRRAASAHCNLADGSGESVRNGSLLREWVILDRAAVTLPVQQRSDHLFLSRPLLDEI